jgi:hypothetical protein
MTVAASELGVNCGHTVRDATSPQGTLKRQWHRPQHIEAELPAGLGIGCDAAWVVVSDACDQTRPNPREWMSLYTAPKDFESAHRELARAISLLRIR